jgi:pSer/pThr/pTyr-binding forkhead associated (FHA) protein
MPPCLLCSVTASLGRLCLAHGVAIASAGLTSEQILSRVTVPTASLIDPWGYGHPIADRSVIGRDPATAHLALLHASVSSVHAELIHEGDHWYVIDKGSRNGTTVDDQPAQRTPLRPGSRIRFGEIGFYFWTPPLAPGDRLTGSGRTAPTRRDQIVFGVKVSTPAGQTVELSQRIDGGIARINGAIVELARMEFGLLQLLAERRRTTADPELSYVAWHEIADALAFKSVEADSENVRELVRRVRRKLSQVGIDDLIESRQGVGYRLSGALV